MPSEFTKSMHADGHGLLGIIHLPQLLCTGNTAGTPLAPLTSARLLCHSGCCHHLFNSSTTSISTTETSIHTSRICITQPHQFTPLPHLFTPQPTSIHTQPHQFTPFASSHTTHYQLYQFPPQITSISSLCTCFTTVSYLQCKNGSLPWTTAEPSAVHPEIDKWLCAIWYKAPAALSPAACGQCSLQASVTATACLQCRPHYRGRQLHGVYASLQRESHADNVLFLTRLLQSI